MKKLLAVLLALCVIGGFAFAQAKVAVALDGTLTLVDDGGWGSLAYADYAGATGVTFSGTAADGNTGVSVGLTGAAFTTALPAVGSYKAFFTMFDKMVKVSIGKFSMNDYRTASLYTATKNGSLGSTADRLLVQVYPVAGLSLAVNLPYGVQKQALYTLEGFDFGAAYTIKDVGVVKAYGNFDLTTIKTVSTQTLGFGFNYTGNEKLGAAFWYKGAIGATDTHTFNLSGSYAITDAISAALEFQGALAAGEFTGTFYLDGGYVLNDNISFDLAGSLDLDMAYDATLTATYDFGNGLSIAPYVDFDGGLSFAVPVYFYLTF